MRKFLRIDPDQEWDALAAQEPYFSVTTHERYRRINFTENRQSEFFQEGEDHLNKVFETLRRRVSPGFAPRSVLDFGCGVGRMLIPFAKSASRVCGVDVSRHMLREARDQCRGKGAERVTLNTLEEFLQAPSGQFDFVHSFLVFQHIPPPRGLKIFQVLLKRLKPGGCGAVHFLYHHPYPFQHFLKYYVPGAKNVINLLKGRPWSEPAMLMFAYRLQDVFSTLRQMNIRDCFLQFTDHAGEQGVFIFFRKE